MIEYFILSKSGALSCCNKGSEMMILILKMGVSTAESAAFAEPSAAAHLKGSEYEKNNRLLPRVRR